MAPTVNYTDPAAAIPDADLLEQSFLVAPDPLTPAANLLAYLDLARLSADEADLLDQFTALPTADDEDYPHDRLAEGVDG